MSGLRNIELHIPYKTKQLINGCAAGIKSGVLRSTTEGDAIFIDSSGNSYDAKIRLKGDLEIIGMRIKDIAWVYLSKNINFNSFI